MAEKGSTNKDICLPATYTYRCIEATEVRHSVSSSEIECGVQCTILKERGTPATLQRKISSSAAVAAAVRSITASPSTSPPRPADIVLSDQNSEFSVHAHIVTKLFEDRPGKPMRRDLVYLKVSPCGKAFESYDRERNRLVMTLPAYLELLRFFKNEYRLVLNRMESDRRNMTKGKEWMPLISNVCFRGPADTVYNIVLDSSNSFCLNLTVTNRFDAGKKMIMLQYTDETMGQVGLPGPALEILAKDLSYIEGLVKGEYKEASLPKRNRQY